MKSLQGGGTEDVGGCSGLSAATFRVNLNYQKMKIVGHGIAETRPCFQSIEDAVVLFDRLACFWDRAVYDKEKLRESAVSCDGISLEELEQTVLDWELNEERSEETSLRCLVDSLCRELEDLKKEHSRLKDMELEAKHVIAKLWSRLCGKDDSDHVLISEEDLESLQRKSEESCALLEKKVADAMTELDILRRSESEALMKHEVARRELKDVKSAREAAVKRAKLAETSKAALEEELRSFFLKEWDKPVLVHASAWAAQAENLPGHHGLL